MDEYYSENLIGAFDLLSNSYPLVLPTLHVQPNLTEPYNPHQVMMEGASMLHSGMFEGVVSDPLCYHQNQVQGLMDSSSHLQGSTTVATANLAESVEYWDKMLSTVDDTAIMEPQLVVTSSSNLAMTTQQLIGSLQPEIPALALAQNTQMCSLTVSPAPIFDNTPTQQSPVNSRMIVPSSLLIEGENMEMHAVTVSPLWTTNSAAATETAVHSQAPVPGSVLSVSSTNSPPGQVKSRWRWTNELNNIFVDAVNRLGGRERATPANILKLMKVNGLKLHHVKSHLQKYRACCLLEESSKINVGSQQNRPAEQELSPIEAEKDLALNLQCDIQKMLAEHTEVQRKIQQSVEEQGRQLQMLLENQLNFLASTSSNGGTVIHRCP